MRKNLSTLILVLLAVLACNPSSNEPATSISEAPPNVSKATPTVTPKTNQLEAPPTQSVSTQSQTKDESSQFVAGNKWSLWVDGPHLRGANIWQAVVVPKLDGSEFKGPGPVGPPFAQEDFYRLAELGANYVSISGPGLFTETPPYTVDPGIQKNLDNLLAMIAEADMFATIGFRTGPGRSEYSLCCEGDSYFDGYFNDSVWEDQAAQDAWVEMWRYTAERYGDNPIVAGYKLMVEPNANGILLDMYDPDEFYAEYAGTLYDWNQFYPHIVDGIRQVDANTPILVGGMSWSGVEWLPYLQTNNDPRTVYIIHQYEPQEQYTHQEPDGENTYPGVFDTDWDNQPDQFDRAWLDSLLSMVDDFAATHNVPLAVDEFGVVRWVPNAAEFMDDQMDLFEQRGMNHALWEWSTSWKPFTDEVNHFNFRLGADPDNRVEIPNDLLDVIIRHWSRNTIRPSNFAGAVGPETAPADTGDDNSPSNTGLANVTHWLYLIDANLGDDTVEQIVHSEYDMVVLDFIPSEANNTDYPMADVVEQLHNAPHPKLVIAYIDIGQAEDYRTYWQPHWKIGDPEWIVGGDPDGWEGNYPVAFWWDEWQDIWLRPEGILQAILDAGFDGIYLDWVEAYSDEHVTAAAENEDVDPRQEMIRFVGDMAEFARNQNRDFIVIGQNAAELASFDEYVDTIDAIAQEQIWFDGAADNDPPGDCPLPRTEADIDSAVYYQNLSPKCRLQYDNFPESTLHMSSEEYLQDLMLAKNKGLLILTVDYALEPENVTWVYETSRGLGFVPFVGSRALDQYIAPQP